MNVSGAFTVLARAKAAAKVYAAAVPSSSMTIRSRVAFTLHHLSMARR